MSELASQRAREFYAETYAATVPDWPGEIDYYLAMAAEAHAGGHAVLEVACGTGRVAIRLARAGFQVAGLDLSQPMLDVAREESAGLDNVRWVQGDMRAFDLDRTFGLAIIPGHSFQNILSAADQLACLQSIWRHLVPGGPLVVHLDHPELDWLGELAGDQGGVFEETERFAHPKSGRRFRTLQAWWYEPATQTAVSHRVWEELDAEGQVVDRLDRGPVRLHVVYRFEMEHLLARAGFEVTALYGDFFGGEFRDDSSDMVWVAKRIDP